LLRIIKVIIFTFIFCLLLPLDHLDVQAETDDGNKSVAETFEENAEKENNENNTEPPTPFNGDEEVETIDNQFGAFDFFNVIFALFLVLMLLYVTLRFIKKKNQTYGFTKTMMNLGGTSLGNNRSVQLVKVGDRILVVGVGEDIQLLKEIDSEEEIQQILSQQQNDVQQLLQPSDIISKLVQQVKGYKKQNDKQQDSFKSLLASQLSDLSKGRKNLLQELDKKGNKNDD
jgi:flagellar protein FliO/FliZ